MNNSDLKEIREKRKKVICDLVNDSMYVPMKEKELAVFLQVSREDREEFRFLLQELLADGKLQQTAKGKYIKGDNQQLVGTFISHSKGFGFVEIEGREDDLYIPEDKVGGAFHKDTVQVVLLPGGQGNGGRGGLTGRSGAPRRSAARPWASPGLRCS